MFDPAKKDGGEAAHPTITLVKAEPRGDMARDPLRAVVRHLSAVGGRPVVDPTDQQLLDRFVAARDEDAFAALVRRHGRLVWGVCWRALRHTQDAEDAVQATFLVLARRAAAVRWRGSVANWLYGTAARVAAEVRGRNARDQARRRQAVGPEAQPAPDAAARELGAALDEELHRLPERFRAPLLLCYLEGRTSDQAARQLGWSLRTLERRLAQGRELLRARLTRRGLTLSAVLLAATMSGEAARADAAIAAVSPVAESAAAAALAGATLKGMTMWQSKLVALGGTLAVALAGGGFALVKAEFGGPQPPRAGASEPGPKAAPPAAEEKGAGQPAALAGRVWGVMEVVREHHIDPPARNDMTLAAAKALLKASEAEAPDDLARRAAAVTTEAQLAALFRDLWPRGAGRGETDDKMTSAAFGGFLDGIPGRPFVLPEPQVRVNEQLRGNRYVGIGVQIAGNETEQFPQIVTPFRRGAARTAGVKPGDLLTEVDGKSMKGVLDMDKVVTALRGEEGTAVTIAVRQPGSADARTYKLVRAVIPFESVLGYRRTPKDGWDYRIDRDAGIAYVWVRSIKASTLHELRQVERRLRADGAKAVVLDLRFSEGDGHLHDVALLADGLLDGGLMWSVRNKDGTATEYRADRESLFRGWPVVALANGTKDSCQSLLLAALRDNGRAVLVGEPTANDGLVRGLFPLPGGTSAVTVVIGRLERAAPGKAWPVRPDHGVTPSKDQQAAVQKWLTDKMLPELPAGTADQPPTDPQIDHALALLRKALQDEGKR